MKVLVVRQPWAWLIVNGFKPIENRSRRTLYRGPVLIQASSRWEPRIEYLRRVIRERFAIDLPRYLESGGIIGMVTLTDCLSPDDYDPAIDSVWREPGQFGWVLHNARPLPFLRRSGSLGLIDATPEEIVHAG
jgi:hypothetical protein